MTQPIGTGAWAWGDRNYWAAGKPNSESDAQAAFETSLENRVNFFDTAEIYGFGASERLLRKFIRSASQPVIVATKFLPFPWRLRKQDLIEALKRSLERLGLDRVDFSALDQASHDLAIRRIDPY